MTKRRRKGTGTIERVVGADGVTRFRARLPTEEGPRQPLGVYASEAEADMALKAATEEIVSAQAVRLTGVTLRIFGPRFLDYREGVGIHGVGTERNRWKNHIDADPIADIPMAGVQRADAKAWLKRMLSKKIRYSQKHSRNGKKLGRTTLQNTLNLVSKAFDEAVEDGIIRENPFAGLKLPTKEARTHEPWTYLLPEEQTRLLDSLGEGSTRWNLVAFALFTGARQAEQWSLQWPDAHKLAVVLRYGEAGKATKGRRPRQVPLLGPAAAAVDGERHRELKSPLVFPNRLGARRAKGEPSWWKDALEDAGIIAEQRHDQRPVRWHDLRHSCASSLVAGWWGRQWSLYEVKEMLGHRSVTTTERYAHLAGSVLELAAKGTTYKPVIIPTTVPALPEWMSDKERES